MIRFEDLLFDPRGMAAAACACLGGDLAPEDRFKIEGKAKGSLFGHSKNTNSRAAALELYGSAAKRLAPYEPSDLAVVRKRLAKDANWLAFGYDAGLPA